jgi:hypothetical protein
VTSAGNGFADDDYDNMLATANGIEQAGKQASVGETHAPAHLIRVGQGISDARAMFGEQVGMPFGNVSLPFIG